MSQEFALGWAEDDNNAPAHIRAFLNGQIVGSTTSTIRRKDLEDIAAKGGARARSFTLLYDRPLDDRDVASVEIYHGSSQTPMAKIQKLRIDRHPRLRIFILGSPRSGTSELGDTLARQLELPWLGEGHAAPLFAAAANSFTGDIDSPNGLVRFLAQQNFRQIAIDAARTAYYSVHASASFLDKTPGHPMISATPFLLECFPDAKFIFLYRNGISNVLSRMAKFGGNFETHCTDWATAMTEWLRVKQLLPHYLELRQEDMLLEPHDVAMRAAQYLGYADKADGIARSLGAGSRERTGAGIGRDTLSQTEWSAAQVSFFKRVCGPMMEHFSYQLS
ncbi:sulfotransferase family protein [Bradyrhizobium sp. HKCCYLS2038]|uniref:sulfotransferase family protein n=1 Tax=unclassified Bradyrhizobium TaxID=2631580 RepID=UPI003EC08D08